MKKIVSLAAALCVITALHPAKIYADSKSVGAFTVTGGSWRTDYSYEYKEKVLKVLTDCPLTIRNSGSNSTTDRIVIKKDINANVTLAGVNIQRPTGPALEIEGNRVAGSSGNVTITLKEGTTNILKAGYNAAGLQKNGSKATGTLTIKGEGTLEATGNSAGAGIGGGSRKDSGGYYMPDPGTSNIIIKSGNITAKGGDSGAGIGSGSSQNTYMASNITISGGIVNATGISGAGIGGAYSSMNYFAAGAHNIRITGGVVSAKSSSGAGIGGGRNGSAFDVVIDGGSVKAESKFSTAIGPAALTVKNSKGKNVHLLVIPNPDREKVLIDSKAYDSSVHNDDDNLYAYLSEESHTVQVGNQITVYDYTEGSFKERLYTISFDLNGGEGNIKPVSVKDKISVLPHPLRYGYVFDGWYTEKDGGEKVDTDTIFTKDATLYAHWKLNAYGLIIEKIEDQTYTGTPITPEVVVKDGQETLVKDKDYKVVYSNNRNAGTGTVTVIRTGSYEETKSENFTILPKTISVSGITASDKTYDGKTAALLDDTNAVIDGKAENDDVKVYAVGTFSDANAGDNKLISIALSLIGNDAGNYVISSDSQTTAYASVNKADPMLSVTADILKLNASSMGDGTVSYTSDNTGILTIDESGNIQMLQDGSAVVTAALNESANYMADTVKVNFNKTGDKITIDNTVIHKVYGDPDFSVRSAAVFEGYEASGDITVSVDGNVHIHAVGTGTVTASVFNGNYHIRQTMNVYASKRPVTVTWSTPDSFIYDGNEQSIHAEADSVNGDAVNLVYDNANAAEAGTYHAVITGVDNDNYTLTGADNLTHNWIIKRRNVTLVSADAEKEYDGMPLKNSKITVQEDGFASGQGVSYKFLGSQTETGESENIFTYALKAGTSENNYNITTAYGLLSVTEKEASLDPVPPVNKPVIMEGDGQSITAGEKIELTFRSDADYKNFIKVEINKETLDEKYYTKWEGSTYVKLSADYVSSLASGNYTIGIVSENGTAEAQFTVKPAGVLNGKEETLKTDKQSVSDNTSVSGNKKTVKKTSPETSDSGIHAWIIVLLGAVIILAFAGKYRMKKQ